jgi:hypothetical protein
MRKRLTDMYLMDFASDEKNVSHTMQTKICTKLPLENKTEIMKQKQMLATMYKMK